MLKIIVDKKTLNERISNVEDGELMELAIIPSQFDQGNYAPSFLHLAAIHIHDTYEELESIDEYSAKVG